MSTATEARDTDLDAISTTLLASSSLLTRRLMSSGQRDLSRTEIGLLKTLQTAPRSVSELADDQSVAQPTMSRLVLRMERRGLLQRQRAATDGRVVTVSITRNGETSMNQALDHIRSTLRHALAQLESEDIDVLLASGKILERLIALLADDMAGRQRR